MTKVSGERQDLKVLSCSEPLYFYIDNKNYIPEVATCQSWKMDKIMCACVIVAKEALDIILKHLCSMVPAYIWPANREKAAQE